MTRANDSDAPSWLVWLIVVSQITLLTLACSEQINDGLRWLGVPVAAAAPPSLDDLNSDPFA